MEARVISWMDKEETDRLVNELRELTRIRLEKAKKAIEQPANNATVNTVSAPVLPAEIGLGA